MNSEISLPQHTVLIVDDDEQLLELLGEIVDSMGCVSLQAASIAAARKCLEDNKHISVLLFDQLLPDGSGLDFCRELKKSRPETLRILITGFPEAQVALSAINDGEIFRFITKPCSADNVRVTLKEAMDRFRLVQENQRLQGALLAGNERLQKTNAALQQALSNSVKLCFDLLDHFDHVLASHSSRVAKWAVTIGKTLHLSTEELESLEIAAQMHDIGLISVSRSSHSCQQLGWADLSPSQQSALHAHPKTGAELVQFLHQKGVPEIIRAHHEWFDGGGYPNALSGDRIPFASSILAVPDAYDEVPMERMDAARFIEDNLGTRFHPEVGRAFLRLLQDRPEMAEREREVLISELEAGMKLSCNVSSASGVLLVPKGQILTPKLIQYILQHNVSDPLTQRLFISV